MNITTSTITPRVLALTALVLVAGCVGPVSPTQSKLGTRLPVPGADGEYQVGFPDPGHGMARYIRLTLGEDMASSCGLARTHFEFDSAEPLPQDKLVLHALAVCLDQPKFQDVPISLEGRADSRGAAGYNAALGLRRALHVKKLLVEAGVLASRITTGSKGDTGAVGDDVRYSYGYDRRVDAIVHVTHAPR